MTPPESPPLPIAPLIDGCRDPFIDHAACIFGLCVRALPGSDRLTLYTDLLAAPCPRGGAARARAGHPFSPLEFPICFMDVRSAPGHFGHGIC